MQKSSSSSSRNSSSSRKSPTPIPIPKTSPKTRYDRERAIAINEVITDTKLHDDVADIIKGMLGKEEPSSHFRYGITLDDLNIPELGLNPNVYPLIKIIIDKYGGIDTVKLSNHDRHLSEQKDLTRLVEFHKNLSKNEEPEVISYLLEIYKHYPTSISSLLLDWEALCNNKGASSLLILKIEDEYKLSREEYTALPKHNKIDWGILFKNPDSAVITLVSELVGEKGNIPLRSYNIYLKNQRVAEEKHIEMLQKKEQK
jgi:hypothetical protein